jgi:hypothetical protein
MYQGPVLPRRRRAHSPSDVDALAEYAEFLVRYGDPDSARPTPRPSKPLRNPAIAPNSPPSRAS